MHKKYILLIGVIIVIVAGVSYFLIHQTPSCQSQYTAIETDMDQANYCQVDADCDILILGAQYVDFWCYTEPL